MLFATTATIAEETARPDPLDGLRQRSAEARWEEIRNEWLLQQRDVTEAAPTPQVGPWPGDAVTTPLPEEMAPPAPPDHDTPSVTPDPDEIAPPVPAADHVVISLPTYLEGAALDEPERVADPGSAATGASAAEPLPPGVLVLQESDPFTDQPRGALRSISQISPYFDYDPDGGDPCQHLCPTPGFCESDEDYLCPVEQPLPESGSAERYFAQWNYFWAPSNISYNPLYFEDPVLERYGQVHIHDAVQPLYSAARFAVQFAGLPYQMALQPVHERVYPLGYFRPGDAAPELIYQPPLNARAGLVAAGVYTGLFFLVP